MRDPIKDHLIFSFAQQQSLPIANGPQYSVAIWFTHVATRGVQSYFDNNPLFIHKNKIRNNPKKKSEKIEEGRS